jgi:hypothetical protein
MSEAYARDAPRAISTGFAMLMVLSIAATILLIVAVLAYASGSPARIASDYTSVASPANQALAQEVDGYSHDRDHDLAAAKSDLLKEVSTLASFDTQLATVAFPGAAATAATALTGAEENLAKLIRLQVRAPSLRRLRSFDPRVEAAAAAVKTEAGLIRRDLGLPPSSGELF